jgi:hypothetical protein
MAEPEIKYLGDVQRLVLREGDRLVITYHGTMSEAQVRRMREQIETSMPGVRVLVLCEGMKIGVLAKEE